MLKRQRTGSVVCTSCGVLVGVNDDRCYNCGRRNPGLWGFAPLLRSLGGDLGFVPLVIGACIILYALTLLASRGNIGAPEGSARGKGPANCSVSGVPRPGRRRLQDRRLQRRGQLTAPLARRRRGSGGDREYAGGTRALRGKAWRASPRSEDALPICPPAPISGIIPRSRPAPLRGPPLAGRRRPSAESRDPCRPSTSTP